MRVSELNAKRVRNVPDLALQRDLLPSSRKFVGELKASLASGVAHASTDNLIGSLEVDATTAPMETVAKARMSDALMNVKMEGERRGWESGAGVANAYVPVAHEAPCAAQAVEEAALALLAARVGGGAPVAMARVVKSCVELVAVQPLATLSSALFKTQRKMTALAHRGGDAEAQIPHQILLLTQRLQSLATCVDNLASVGLVALGISSKTLLQGTRRDDGGVSIEAGACVLSPSPEAATTLTTLPPSTAAVVMRTLLTLDLLTKDAGDELCFLDGLAQMVVADTMVMIMASENTDFVRDMERSWRSSAFGASTVTQRSEAEWFPDFEAVPTTTSQPPMPVPVPPTPERSPPPLLPLPMEVEEVREVREVAQAKQSFTDLLTERLYHAVAALAHARMDAAARPEHPKLLSPRTVIAFISPVRATSALALAASALQGHWRE